MMHARELGTSSATPSKGVCGRQEVEGKDHPVLVSCKAGGRAGIFASTLQIRRCTATNATSIIHQDRQSRAQLPTNPMDTVASHIAFSVLKNGDACVPRPICWFCADMASFMQARACGACRAGELLTASPPVIGGRGPRAEFSPRFTAILPRIVTHRHPHLLPMCFFCLRSPPHGESSTRARADPLSYPPSELPSRSQLQAPRVPCCPSFKFSGPFFTQPQTAKSTCFPPSRPRRLRVPSDSVS